MLGNRVKPPGRHRAWQADSCPGHAPVQPLPVPMIVRGVAGCPPATEQRRWGVGGCDAVTANEWMPPHANYKPPHHRPCHLPGSSQRLPQARLTGDAANAAILRRPIVACDTALMEFEVVACLAPRPPSSGAPPFARLPCVQAIVQPCKPTCTHSRARSRASRLLRGLAKAHTCQGTAPTAALSHDGHILPHYKQQHGLRKIREPLGMLVSRVACTGHRRLLSWRGARCRRCEANV